MMSMGADVLLVAVQGISTISEFETFAWFFL